MMPTAAEPAQLMLATASSDAELAPAALRSGDGAIRALAQRLLLSSRSETPLQDQLDCAEAALELGFGATARLLFSAGFIRMGRGPDALAFQQAVSARTSLWPTHKVRGVSAPTLEPKFQLDLSIDELSRLATLADGLPTISAAEAARGLFVEEVRASMAADPPAMAAPAVVARIVDDLHLALVAADVAGSAAALQKVQDELLSRPTPLAADHVHGSIFELAALSAAASTRELFSHHQDLAWAPFGSPEILLECAGAVGLGPYLSKIAVLLRQPGDLLGLAHMAAHDRRLVGHLIVLCAGSLTGDQLDELGAMLRAHGMYHVVYALAAAAQRRRLAEPGIFVHARGAALAEGDAAAVIDAQRCLVEREVEPKRDEHMLLQSLVACEGRLANMQAAITGAAELARVAH